MYRFAALLITIPLAAQVPAEKWSFVVYGCSPELTGNYHDSTSAQTNFDIKRDLKLKNNKTSLGVRMDYLGSRFGFSLDYGIHDFAGQSRINRQIGIGGQTFYSGMDITSSLKNNTFDLNGIIKVLRASNIWLGLDIGIQAWLLDIRAKGISTAIPLAEGTTTEKVTKTVTVPIPQIGLSFGFRDLQNSLELGGNAHFLAYNGAKYMRFAAEARYYVLSWLGVRAFLENQGFDAPHGSINDNIEAKLDNSRLGFGVALRW